MLCMGTRSAQLLPFFGVWPAKRRRRTPKLGRGAVRAVRRGHWSGGRTTLSRSWPICSCSLGRQFVVLARSSLQEIHCDGHAVSFIRCDRADGISQLGLRLPGFGRARPVVSYIFGFAPLRLGDSGDSGDSVISSDEHLAVSQVFGFAPLRLGDSGDSGDSVASSDEHEQHQSA
jgi:hypothetical protein